MKGLRITGGMLARRNIKVPRRDVRPTQDMVREAFFAILGESIIDSRFLDLFGGSGAVGIEAWSRGAESVCWVEEDGAVLKVLRDNVEQLCDDGARVIRGDAATVLKRGTGGEEPFDIIFADPPYHQITDDGQQTTDCLMNAIDEGGALKNDGLFVLEMAQKRAEVTMPDGWTLVDERAYGRTKLFFFRRDES